MRSAPTSSQAQVAAPPAGISSMIRIGLSSRPGDPFWVQVFEEIYRTAHEFQVEVVPLPFETPGPNAEEEQRLIVEELLAQELVAIVSFSIWPRLVSQILAASIPIISLNETSFRHPLLVSPQGLYESGTMIATYIADCMSHAGEVLVVGGGDRESFEDDGRSRLAGLRAAFAPYACIHMHYVPCGWHDAQTALHLRSGMQKFHAPFRALIGLSDSLALAAKDIGRELGLVTTDTLVAGINGDPAALAAIATNAMVATVETSAANFGHHVVELAYQAAQHVALPSHFNLTPQLVTAENIADVATQKVIALANLPERLVGINRQQEQRRLRQLELSIEINRCVGSILSPRRLSHEIAERMRRHFGYDHVQLFLWSETDQVLVLDPSGIGMPSRIRIPLGEAGLLGQAMIKDEPLFIPDTQHSYRFPPDPYWPRTRSRVVLPIHAGGRQLGLLDLHSERTIELGHQEFVGLQALVDQLGIAMQNAELYSAAELARTAAEKANQLKTRLLANVSHELRTPLNVILGYSGTALRQAHLSAVDSSERVAVRREDVLHIHHSAEHLLRLINDLLDLSRAEIDALHLIPELLAPRAFLEEVFRSMATTAASRAAVCWHLEIPDELPLIDADSVRLRQVLLNLLSNADTFTQTGEIVLGAEVLPPHLHIWVRDTGDGIPIELQERIFEPFVSASQAEPHRSSVGLGLAITRRLVALHGGVITLDSQPGQGSTFHVYLPLAGVHHPVTTLGPEREFALLVISARDEAPPALMDWVQRRHARFHRLSTTDDPQTLLREVQPAALAWDLSDAGQDAWTIIERFRSYPEYFQAPLILYNQERRLIPNLSLGMTNVLTKPLDQHTFVEMVGTLRQPDASEPLLIIDDDVHTRDYYADLISREFPDAPVLTAPSGAVALSVVAQQTPSLVILDLMMPEMDGFEVLAQLRLDPHTRRVPVLVLSGRILSLEDIQRLDYPYVVVQSKGLLSDEETVEHLRQMLGGVATLPQQTSAVVKRVLAYLHQHYAQPLSRQQIGRAVGVSEGYLSRIFHQELGLSPWEYLIRYRILQAKALLRTTDVPIAEVALHVGFDDPNYFSRVFRKVAGRSPRAYRAHPD